MASNDGNGTGAAPARGRTAGVFETARERTASQIARIRFSPGAHLPALNSAVDVHMHYTQLSARIASVLVGLFGLDEL